MYIQAMEMAKGQEFNAMRAAALIYLAREEMISQTPMAEQLLELAIQANKKSSHPDIRAILNNVVRLKEEMDAEYSNK